jgi:hypothetical protein
MNFQISCKMNLRISVSYLSLDLNVHPLGRKHIFLTIRPTQAIESKKNLMVKTFQWFVAHYDGDA